MMQQKVYSVFDQAACAYLPPFFLPTNAMAVRVFRDCCKDPKHEFGRNPKDFYLHCLGSWNSHDGKFETGHAECIATGLQATLEGAGGSEN